METWNVTWNDVFDLDHVSVSDADHDYEIVCGHVDYHVSRDCLDFQQTVPRSY